ncbi:hypothetical protein [Alkalilimnicola ehrlichii]|uniref:hypothetical protein n=1 Tax=Alkalilimnicola ehrlichii TaxID=351052 RepID=UPI0015F251CF|nr:hypothetical protein [Alkalilimnicola ehrlichii]
MNNNNLGPLPRIGNLPNDRAHRIRSLNAVRPYVGRGVEPVRPLVTDQGATAWEY